MHERILVAGYGGQGVISLGKFIAGLAVETIPHITFFPAYGAEVRGGTSNCQVILSDRVIASPVASCFDVMFLMNQRACDVFLPSLDRRGLAVINASLGTTPPNRRYIQVKASDIAIQQQNPRAANVVMLGALLAVNPILSEAAVKAGIRSFLADAGEAIIASNIQAFEAGLAAGRSVTA